MPRWQPSTSLRMRSTANGTTLSLQSRHDEPVIDQQTLNAIKFGIEPQLASVIANTLARWPKS